MAPRCRTKSVRSCADDAAAKRRAREEQADKLFREIIEIADDASGDYITTSDGKRIVDHEIRLGRYSPQSIAARATP